MGPKIQCRFTVYVGFYGINVQFRNAVFSVAIIGRRTQNPVFEGIMPVVWFGDFPINNGVFKFFGQLFSTFKKGCFPAYKRGLIPYLRKLWALVGS